MKSRYSAYAAGESAYIIKTTHPDNPDFSEDMQAWKRSIDLFSQETHFQGLKILEWIDAEAEAYVTFKASLSTGELIEKSRFLKISGRWLYVDGVFENQAQTQIM